MEKVVGRLVKGVTVPAAAGLAPSASYGIAVTDEQAVDVLASCKKNLTGRSATATEEVYFFVLNQDVTPLSTVEHPTVCEKLTIAVTAAGNSKAGTIYLYYDPKQ